MKSKEQALAEIVKLIRAHDIQPMDIASALQRPVDATNASHGIAMRLFAILGGIFIFSGIGTYIGMFWQDMNSAARVIITLGAGFAMYLMAVVFARNGHYSKAVAPLLLISAYLQPAGILVAIYEYFPHGNEPRYALLFTFGLMTLQQVFTFVSLRHAILLFNSIFFAAAFTGTGFDLMGMPDKLNAIITGVSLMLIGYGIRPAIYPRTAAHCYFIGGALFQIGLFQLLQHKAYEPLYLAVTCFMVYISIITQSVALLWVAVISLLSYIGYYTAEHFAHTVGWPVALILLGLIFLAVSAGAVRIKKNIYKRITGGA